MPNWTKEQFEAHQMRTAVQNYESRKSDEIPEGEEYSLHDKIIQECRRRGWIALHGRMDFATGRTKGEFDFIILANSGRVFFIECKTRTGKLSPDQYAIHHQAKSLSHQPHVIRSFQQFLELVR